MAANRDEVDALAALAYVSFALVTKLLKESAAAGDPDAVLEIISEARAFLEGSKTTTRALQLAIDQITSFEQTVRAMAENPDAWRPQ